MSDFQPHSTTPPEPVGLTEAVLQVATELRLLREALRPEDHSTVVKVTTTAIDGQRVTEALSAQQLREHANTARAARAATT